MAETGMMADIAAVTDNNRRYAERNSYGDRDNDGRYYEG